MNKNQILFDEIAKSLNYIKHDDRHYETEHGNKYVLTTRGFVSFNQWKEIANGENKDYSNFWRI